MEDKNRIYIFDTTLRDGEQSPGASLDEKGKLEIARQLADSNGWSLSIRPREGGGLVASLVI